MFRWLGPLALVALSVGLHDAWTERAVDHPPGVLAPDEPQQTPVRGSPGPFERAGFRMTPLAEFSIEARVLGKERYRFDPVSKLSPVDLALGWGPMSDSAVLGRIQTFQNTRFWHWRYAGEPPIPPEQIASSGSNVHMIPAGADIERRLLRIRRGQVVIASGYLVSAVPANGAGPEWRSSLTRTDAGAGACEIFYVTALSVR